MADGFEAAYLGVGQQFSLYCAVYSLSQARQVLMDRDGMDYVDAQEYLDFTVLGAYVGAHTPIFLLDDE